MKFGRLSVISLYTSFGFTVALHSLFWICSTLQAMSVCAVTLNLLRSCTVIIKKKYIRVSITTHSVCCEKNHRIIKWSGLYGTCEGRLVQLPLQSAGAPSTRPCCLEQHSDAKSFVYGWGGKMSVYSS